jgi:hypothetical protein
VPSATTYAGTYTVSGGGVSLSFTVDGTGKVTSCSAGALVVCSGTVAADGSFNISGNDGLSPVDTSATLKGTIGAGGQVTGTFTSTSRTEGNGQGSLSGTRTSGGGTGTGQGSGTGAGDFYVHGGITWTKVANTLADYEGAVQRCQRLNQQGTSGTGWRLPTQAEVVSLSQSGYKAWHPVNSDYFFQLWTSTPAGTERGVQLYNMVYVGDGKVYPQSMYWTQGNACVRAS